MLPQTERIFFDYGESQASTSAHAHMGSSVSEPAPPTRPGWSRGRGVARLTPGLVM